MMVNALLNAVRILIVKRIIMEMNIVQKEMLLEIIMNIHVKREDV